MCERNTELKKDGGEREETHDQRSAGHVAVGAGREGGVTYPAAESPLRARESL
jgi:hypothetical protein